MTSGYQGKVCIRCGVARTSNLSKGQPVCTPCQKAARQHLAADAEPKRLCPIEGAEMEKVPMHDVLIDRFAPLSVSRALIVKYTHTFTF